MIDYGTTSATLQADGRDIDEDTYVSPMGGLPSTDQYSDERVAQALRESMAQGFTLEQSLQGAQQKYQISPEQLTRAQALMPGGLPSMGEAPVDQFAQVAPAAGALPTGGVDDWEAWRAGPSTDPYGTPIEQQEAFAVSPGFDWRQYINQNPDLQQAGIDTEAEARRHFTHYGRYENRPGMGAAPQSANEALQLAIQSGAPTEQAYGQYTVTPFSEKSKAIAEYGNVMPIQGSWIENLSDKTTGYQVSGQKGKTDKGVNYELTSTYDANGALTGYTIDYKTGGDSGAIVIYDAKGNPISTQGYDRSESWRTPVGIALSFIGAMYGLPELGTLISGGALTGASAAALGGAALGAGTAAVQGAEGSDILKKGAISGATAGAGAALGSANVFSGTDPISGLPTSINFNQAVGEIGRNIGQAVGSDVVGNAVTGALQRAAVSGLGAALGGESVSEALVQGLVQGGVTGAASGVTGKYLSDIPKPLRDAALAAATAAMSNADPKAAAFNALVQSAAEEARRSRQPGPSAENAASKVFADAVKAGASLEEALAASNAATGQSRTADVGGAPFETSAIFEGTEGGGEDEFGAFKPSIVDGKAVPGAFGETVPESVSSLVPGGGSAIYDAKLGGYVLYDQDNKLFDVVDSSGKSVRDTGGDKWRIDISYGGVTFRDQPTGAETSAVADPNAKSFFDKYGAILGLGKGDPLSDKISLLGGGGSGGQKEGFSLLTWDSLKQKEDAITWIERARDEIESDPTATQQDRDTLKRLSDAVRQNPIYQEAEKIDPLDLKIDLPKLARLEKEETSRDTGKPGGAPTAEAGAKGEKGEAGLAGSLQAGAPSGQAGATSVSKELADLLGLAPTSQAPAQEMTIAGEQVSPQRLFDAAASKGVNLPGNWMQMTGSDKARWLSNNKVSSQTIRELAGEGGLQALRQAGYVDKSGQGQIAGEGTIVGDGTATTLPGGGDAGAVVGPGGTGAGAVVGPGATAGTGMGAGTGAGAVSGAGTVIGAGTGAGTGTGSGTGVGAGTTVGTAGPGAGVGAGAATGTGTGAAAGTATGPGGAATGTGTGTGTKPGTGPGAGTGTGTGTGTGSGPGAGGGGPGTPTRPQMPITTAIIAGAAGPEIARLAAQYLQAKETSNKYVDPLAEVKRIEEEFEREAMMQNIDPRLMQILMDRMGQEQQQTFDRGFYTYGEEQPIEDIMGSREYAEGGYVAPLQMNEGGEMPMALMAKKGGLPREDFRDGKHVAGDGDGQSDDIPAWLADGEFVFPADVVSALGNGSTKAGTDKLYEMMHSIRARARSKGPKDLPPPALKSPLDYLKSKG